MPKSNKHVSRRNVALGLVATGACGSLASSAFATNYTWLGTGGNNNWNNNLNWVDQNGANVVPPLTPPAGDVTNLFFSGTFTTVQTSTQNTGPMDVNQIVLNANFNAATLGIAGSTTGDQFINLGAGGIVGNVPELAGAGTVNFTAGANRKIILTADQAWSNNNTLAIISMRRAVEGNFKITKTGPGTIEFQTSSPLWTGGLDIQDGYIRGAGASDVFGPGPISSVSDNNTGFSASGSVNQNIAGPLTLGGAGSFAFRGSNSFFVNNTLTLTSDKTVSVSQPVTLNGAVGGNFVFRKTSSGSLTVNAANTHGGFVVDGGWLVYGADDRLGAAGAPVGLSGGTLQPSAAIVSTRNINLTESGGFIDGGANNLSFGNADGDGLGTFTKVGSGVLTVNRVRGAHLDIQGGSVKFAAGASAGEPDRVSVVTGLTLAGGTTPTTTLDLTNNALVVDYAADPPPPAGEPLNTIRAQVTSAYSNGAWSGPGITSSLANNSSHGVGYAEASDLAAVPPVFGTVDATAVLVRYTRYGDATLDGIVNLADFNRLAANFGSTTATWDDGDFNYDGSVNLSDFNRLAANFGLSAAGPTVTPDDWTRLGAAVPEPASLALFGVAASAAMGRRRRVR